MCIRDRWYQRRVHGFLKSKSFNHEIITEEEMVLYTFLVRLTRYVDYIDSADSLQTYYYLKDPECFYLTERTKKDFMDDVDPANAGTKLMGLMNNIETFIKEMDHNYHYFTKYEWAKDLVQEYRKVETLTLSIAVLMNLVMPLTFLRDGSGVVKKAKFVLDTLSIFQIMISAVLAIAWIFLRYPLEKLLQEDKYKKSKANKTSLNFFETIEINFFNSLISQREVRSFLWYILFCLLGLFISCLLYTSPSPRDRQKSRMPSSA
eukprot:TRINITY_DN24777_c0_g1_i1.p1 TRINITY_DN24777_c0_g1~~TRINITY_DN24777_c0_g1_i1.p1  ORF type:complete len:262 (+),score=41.33 TRINITY_DN24777_c0_g1_i1:65-850(+)